MAMTYLDDKVISMLLVLDIESHADNVDRVDMLVDSVEKI